jgi:hypothetical protein
VNYMLRRGALTEIESADGIRRTVAA